VRSRLEVEPLKTCYYDIFKNFNILVILLEVNPTFGDEREIFYEGFYETEDTSIFTWFAILGVRHYRWLHGSIHQLPPHGKADYLVCII
jgi:hypothetical protein